VGDKVDGGDSRLGKFVNIIMHITHQIKIICFCITNLLTRSRTATQLLKVTKYIHIEAIIFLIDNIY